jgi:cGMP-dependent protein kinase 1
MQEATTLPSSSVNKLPAGGEHGKVKKPKAWYYPIKKILCPCLKKKKLRKKKKKNSDRDAILGVEMTDNPMRMMSSKTDQEIAMVENPLRAKQNSPSRTPLKSQEESININDVVDGIDDVSRASTTKKSKHHHHHHGHGSVTPDDKNTFPSSLDTIVGEPDSNEQTQDTNDSNDSDSTPMVNNVNSGETPSGEEKTESKRGSIWNSITSSVMGGTPATTPIVTDTTSDTGAGGDNEISDAETTLTPTPRKSLWSAIGLGGATETKEELESPSKKIQWTKCKSGWIFRENELSKNDRNEEPWIKLWACVLDRRLLFNKTKPQTESLLTYGFIEILPHTSVKFTHLDKVGIDKSKPDSGGRNCFLVKNPPNESDTGAGHALQITFSTVNEKDRLEWVDALRECIRVDEGVKDAGSPSANDITADDDKGIPPLVINMVDDLVASDGSTELPKKIGPLKKLAIGGFMGVKTKNNRWFRLDGGELRYYATEDMRPIKLKGTISLHNGCLLEKSSDNHIDLQIGNDKGGQKVLQLEATTAKEAQDWREKLSQTFVGLRVRSQGSSGERRRQNMADLSSNDDKDDTSTGDITGWDRMQQRIEAKSERIIMDCLNQHYLTKKCDDVKGLVPAFRQIYKLPGDVIIAQGAPGDFFYILEHGSADVLMDGRRVATIPAGKSFGDLALLTSTARTATVKARQVCKLWTLDRPSLRRFLSRYEKDELAKKIAFLKGVKLFDKFNANTLERIAEVMRVESFNPNDVIFRRGDNGECFYMVQKGKISIYISSMTGGRTEFVRLGAGKFFGELALIDDAPRKASAAALEKTICWVVDRVHFNALVGSVDQAREESIGVEILKKVKLMEGLSDKQLVAVARCLVTVKFAQGEAIINQGEDGETFYMVASGDVTVIVNHAEVAKLSDGAFFGEGSLMKNEKRSATVMATTDVECLSLCREDFQKHLGPVLEAIKEEQARKEAELAEANKGFMDSALSATTNLFSSSELAQGLGKGQHNKKYFKKDDGMFDLDQLDRVRFLGRGTFANTYMVCHTTNDTYYAVKVWYKQKLYRMKQERTVFTERDIMKLFDNSFFTAQYATLQDEHSLYMVQQLVPGGDMYSLLRHNHWYLDKTRLGGLEILPATFYVANVLTIIGHLHDADVVFRDLKPENFGLDSSGYLRLYDFGCAKILRGDETSNTMVGTPEYLSPEMITSKGHNRGTDIWSLGILIYEILTAKTPFEHVNSAMIYQNIMESEDILKVAFSKGFDPHAHQLILGLLNVNPHMRIGMLRDGLKDIWDSPFFSSSEIDHRSCNGRILVPPFKPHDISQQRTDLNDLVIGSFDTDAVPEYEGDFDFTQF